MDDDAQLKVIEYSVRKANSMEEKLGVLEHCFSSTLTSPLLSIGWHHKRYLGFSIPSQLTHTILKEYIDHDTEILEIGAGLGLYASVMGTPRFCKRWIATDHPQTYQEWIPEGNQHPFTPIYLTTNPLETFSPHTPPEKRVLLTIWPEPNSTYFWDDYIQKFNGNTVIIIGTPGVTGDDSMWDLLTEAYPCKHTSTTVCKINLGAFFDFESIYIWTKN